MLLDSVVHRISVEQAARFARDLYGIDGAVSSLPGEYEDNFHLVASEGRQYVLKVMHPAREHSFIDLQCQALQHLAERAGKIQFPRVIPNHAGNPYAAIAASDGTDRLVWLLTFVPGTVLAQVCPHSDELLKSLGRLLGEMDFALQDFDHPAAQRELKWDLSAAGWIKKHVHNISNTSARNLVERFLAHYDSEIVPELANLRRSVIYGDANDYNVLVGDPWQLPRKAQSVIDFGDMHYGLTVSEVAIAAAYAMLGKKDGLRAASSVVAGYHEKFPLQENEIAAVYTLIGTRLAVSVTNSAVRTTFTSADPYVTVCEALAWEALERLAKIHPRFAHYTFRDACGLRAVPQSETLQRWLKNVGQTTHSLFEPDLRTVPGVVLDLSAGSVFLGADPRASECAALTTKILEHMTRKNISVAVGRYNEARLLYSSPLFGANGNSMEERRTIHLGMDLFAEPGTAIHAPLDGVVHALANNRASLDFGPVAILKHHAGDAGPFFTLYGHLETETLGRLKIDQRIARGENFASVGNAKENGGWPPHLHFQIILDLLELETDFPGVAFASQRAVWTSLSPDHDVLVGIAHDRCPTEVPSPPETLATRRVSLGNNLSLSYEKPLKIVRGWMQHLYDETGRAFLDFYNNVPLVGHSHPHVVQAAQEQLALLNTNTRYLHDVVNRYAQRVTALLPEPLRVCFFVNSGSEANELALRLARAHTGREDVVVLEHAYHGHTNTLIDISPYKFDGPGGRGKKPWVHVAPLADDYRGLYRRDDRQAGEKYARHVGEILKRIKAVGRGVAAYIAEILPSVGGQIVFPSGYLEEVYSHVRAAGGVCIADEVQVGFGRLGTRFWGFSTQGVVPDIIVLGKPIGNAVPLAAVITTQEIAASFANGMEFFSTFGGNPVACAAGLAVLDVLEEEHLQESALEVGSYLIARLKDLQRKHPLIGDVRGS